MDSKRSTEVLIDGKIYALGGSEEESYIHRLASYINEMIITLKHQEGFTKQSAEYQNIMIQLNMADDYFKAREQTARLEQQKAEMEKEIYSLKHELVATQMKLESAKLELVETRKSVWAAAGLGQGLLQKIPKRTSCWKPLITSIFMGENCT